MRERAGSSFRCPFYKLAKFEDELWEIDRYDVPNRIEIDVDIIMNDFLPHSHNLPPRDFWM